MPAPYGSMIQADSGLYLPSGTVNGTTGVGKILGDPDGSGKVKWITAPTGGTAGPAGTPIFKGFSAYLSASVPLPASTTVQLVPNVKLYDTENAYSTTTGRFTAPVTGKYLVTARISTFGGSYRSLVSLVKNGGATLQRLEDHTTEYQGATNSFIADLVAGDYIALTITNVSGTAHTIEGGQSVGVFQAALLGVVDASVPPPRSFFASRNAVQATINGDTQVLFNATERNTGGFDTTTGKFTVPSAGIWEFGAAVQLTNGGTSFTLFLRRNGGQPRIVNYQPNSGAFDVRSGTSTYECAVGDVIDVVVNTNAVNQINTNTWFFGNQLSGVGASTTSTSLPTILEPATPWWLPGGADAALANNNTAQELVSVNGTTSRISFPTIAVDSKWIVRQRCLIRADSANWTPIIAHLEVWSPTATQFFAESWDNSNAGRSNSTANNSDWVSLAPTCRFTLPANSVGWYARPMAFPLGPYGAAYHRSGATYSDFHAERIG